MPSTIWLRSASAPIARIDQVEQEHAHQIGPACGRIAQACRR
jgi:hypothetical protein